MARKQLDLDAPLLSVRRFSSKLPSPDGVNKKNNQKPLTHRQQSLPLRKPDWELSEVTKPGAVPFLWEQSPGRPKGGNESESQSPVEPSNTPRLPPGRAMGTPKFLSGEVYQDQNLCTRQTVAPPMVDISALLESLNKEVYGDGGYDSEEYSDALDTLSLAETVSMNCSTSGLSGYSGPDLSADVQTRDLMMSRFLPAAKAMVANTPPKKQSVASPVQSRPVSKELVRVSKAVIGQRKPPLERQKSGSVASYDYSVRSNRSEDEEYEEYDHSGKITMKSRGFFSRFCLKNSLCLINPVPVMKVRTRAPATPVKGVNRLARATHSGPLTQPVDKSSEATVYKQKLRSGARSQEFHTVKNTPTAESARLSYSGDLRTARGPSPNRSFNRGGISPQRNESAKSPFRRSVGFVSVAKDAENSNTMRPQHFPVITRYKPISVSGPITRTADAVKPVESSGTECLSDKSRNFSSGRMNDSAKASKTSNPVSQADRMENLRADLTRLRDNARIGRNNEHILKADDSTAPNVSSSLSLVPPPLPNSPSESWLWRTLPSIPLRHPKKQNPEAPDTGAKWETIVKTSNVHYDRVRYSEELVPRVLQYSN